MEVLKRLSHFWVRVFLIIALCVVLPLSIITMLIGINMERSLQTELSNSIVQNISRNERYLTTQLNSLAYLSNAFVYDDTFRSFLMDENSSLFHTTSYFDEFLNRIDFLTNSEIIRKAKVLVFDKYDRFYTNWSMNYKDYSFIKNEPWVQESLNAKGAISWALFEPGYIENDSSNYISLARTIGNLGTVGDYVGTIIVSINQSDLADLLLEYGYEGDSIAVVLDDGKILMKRGDLITSEIASSLSAEIGEEKSLVHKIDGVDYLVTKYSIPKPWTFDGQILSVLHFTDYSPIAESVRKSMQSTWLLILGGIILSSAVAIYVSRYIVKSITLLTEQVEAFSGENQITGLEVSRMDEIGKLNRGIIRMSIRIRNLFAKVKEESAIKEQYHYESLRANLNPHFLFNTLNTIKWMAVIRKADNISTSIEMLAKVMRYSMNKDGNTVTISEEVDNVISYVYIHNIRYENFITLKIEIPDEMMSLRTQKFILQPIVENAIIHGFDESIGTLEIIIRAEMAENGFYLYVINNGKTISQEAIAQFIERREIDPEIKRMKITGIGLKNVDECLRIRFGKNYGLSLSCENGYTKVTYHLPVLEEEAGE